MFDSQKNPSFPACLGGTVFATTDLKVFDSRIASEAVLDVFQVFRDRPKGRGSPMLLLSRRIGERIVIDNQIVVEVLEIKGNRIRLGIQAPPGSSILREELLLCTSEGERANPHVGVHAGS
jgi:carbon storage regulator